MEGSKYSLLTAYTFVNVVGKTMLDLLLNQTELPSLISFISAFMVFLVSIFRCKKVDLYNWKLIVLGIFSMISEETQAFANLEASNIKIIVLSNIYYCVTNLFMAFCESKAPTLLQRIGLLMVFFTGIFQMGVRETTDPIPIEMADALIFLGTVVDGVSGVFFKRKVEKSIEYFWDFQMGVSFYKSLFCYIYHLYVMLFKKKERLKTLSISHLGIICIVLAVDDILITRLQFKWSAIELFTIQRIIDLFAAAWSDYLVIGYVYFLHILVGSFSILGCFLIVFGKRRHYHFNDQ